MKRCYAFCACLLLTASLVGASPYAPPSQPQDLRFDGGTASVTFEWSPPVLDGGGPVEGYTVHRILNGVLLETENVTATMFTQHGLAPDDTLVVAVNAYNSVGAGPISDPASRGPIPRCDPFGYTIDPPDYRFRPECLLPS